jgi:galactitol PTS system EIIB component
MAKLIVACGTGIATSTHVVDRIRRELEKNNLKINIVQCRISEIESMAEVDDIVVASSMVSNTVKAKVFNAVPLLTGISEEVLLKDIMTAIQGVNK